MLYRVYAQRLPTERDGHQYRADGTKEALYKANLEPVGTFEPSRSSKALQEAKKLTRCPVIAPAGH